MLVTFLDELPTYAFNFWYAENKLSFTPPKSNCVGGNVIKLIFLENVTNIWKPSTIIKFSPTL